jgi:hypothetical protein
MYVCVCAELQAGVMLVVETRSNNWWGEQNENTRSTGIVLNQLLLSLATLKHGCSQQTLRK